MIQFEKLRLYGFKSFVDKTELDIGLGLTGIVGPNGCGKSNLVEALRWSMGESSSKKMRGGSGSMEDVIFSGTAERPARNIAEVSVLLNNHDKSAPSPYNDTDEIEVVRRIERDHGSSYRINGKPARARDVNMLYADILSGANSPYLVSQGKITNIIQSKPLDRRMILEEAAGITGLYARRHEAELRLRATDNNLKRLEDIVGSMEDRLNNLKKQARQANRYRNLSAQIRQLEIMIASLEYKKAYEGLADVETTFSEAESEVADHLTAVTQLTKTQNAQSRDLPDLRQQDAEYAAKIQNHKIALQRLEDEDSRLETQITETGGQLEQLVNDREHEQQTLKENTVTLQRLEEEEKKLLGTNEKADTALKEKETICAKERKAVEELDTRLNTLVEQAANTKAARFNLEQQIKQDTERRQQLQQRITELKERLHQETTENRESAQIEALKQDIASGEDNITAMRAKIEKTESDLVQLRGKKETAEEKLKNQESRLSKIRSEINALESVLHLYSKEENTPVLKDIAPEKGFETALSRALGDTLMASLDENAPVSWQERSLKAEDMPDLPGQATALSGHVKAPKALKLALSQIGYVTDEKQGRKLWQDLKPGQSLVSKDGGYWRWDGLQIKESATDSHSLQLKQKNKLSELQNSLPALEKDAEKAKQALEKMSALCLEAENLLKTLKEDLARSDEDSRNKRRELNEFIESQAEHQAKTAKTEEALSLAQENCEEVKARLSKNERDIKTFDDQSLQDNQTEIENMRESLRQARDTLQKAVSEYELVKQERSRRQARLQAIGDERVNLQNRCIRARERLKELDERETQLKEKAEALKDRPSVIKVEVQKLLDRISEVETDKEKISDRLASIESELTETTRALKKAEAALAQAREKRAHAQATAEERKKALISSKDYIAEHFDLTPEELSAEAALDPDNLPRLSELKEQREKSVRSRDMIGPVNLRADQEAEELEKELGGILEERDDLFEAIEELRQGINKLNKEARARLNLAFDRVNNHFREMFTRLFNGGKAHLALIESDDPLEAGLEIYAQPPGKALQSLSLLSGGEQTLTAIALIFAMFLTNPAPICVLDEVDAPLDDSNVDRFCDLLEEFADKGETRFLIITHHRLTMARMDRLYGVTMAEKGVSQLVSVDINQQLDFLEAA